MSPIAAPARPRQLTGAASICIVIAFFALIYVAEWVPGLLPYSPNFAHSAGPVGSVAFPLTFLSIAVVAAVTALLLWRVNRFALVTLPVLWLIVVSSATYSCMQLRQSCGPRGTLSIGFLILCGGMMFHAIWRNWPTRR
jgi:hypothetical protein